jgi:fatty-acid desaturase
MAKPTCVCGHIGIRPTDFLPPYGSVIRQQQTKRKTMETMLNWAANGLWDLNGWQIVLFVLVMTHITMISVTVFLHRHQAHRALDLHPVVSHFFRFWLWLTTGQVTKEWAAIHRKHHAKCEQAEDPHSPHVHGIKTVLLQGYELYRKEARNADTLVRYGHGTPNDWMERKLYSRFSFLRHRADAAARPDAVGCRGPGGVGGADGLDACHGCGYHQRCSALLGLSQF